MHSLAIILLAAGKGTRMKSDTVKVLHPVAGLPMLAYPVQTARALQPDKLIVVVGHQRDRVEELCGGGDILFVHQQEQLGSGQAVAVTEPFLQGFSGTVAIMCGDVPLIRVETIRKFLAGHRESTAALSVLSVILEDPTGYGRIVRDASGRVQAIVEHRDATPQQKTITEINTGIYCGEAPFLFQVLKKIGRDNDQAEYYLPDIVSLAYREGKKVQAVVTDNFQEVKGINDRVDLSEAERVMRQRILRHHMQDGVTIIDPDSTYIDCGVTIGQDTVIHPNTCIRGTSSIGRNCTIDSNATIINSTVGNNVHIKSSSVIDESQIQDNAAIGPFAHLRPQTFIAEGGRVGNFVEIKKSRLGKGSKANHLTYIGDTTIGDEVNIGAGTITCNYDGKTKHPTVIEDRVFVGSNTSLVAPVRVGKGAVIGAGSTITKDVPAGALAVGRAKQTTYENWFSIKRKKQETDKPPEDDTSPEDDT